ncbi:hypothetical protein BG011_004877 [Mortierella polycephala]|uniref:F-box domain-containing protein n=1 Tax=Mortierella polycephala TaxID=41804 RepID=A0A9P6PZC4_9FUNG|nr:hypothetical protein BG011_004877 [Mortierella polycephala]
MFNIPELDQMVISQLSLHDLTQCARVNKQWHHAVIIHLWSDLSSLRRRWGSPYFYQFVLDDYRRAQQHQQEVGEKSLTAPAILNDPQHRAFSGASFLSEYGPCIRKIPEVMVLWNIFVVTFPGKTPLVEPQAQQVAVQPSANELLHHFLIHCTALKKLSWVDINSQCTAIWKTVAGTAVQHVQELDIKVIRMAVSTCQYILSQCSNKLETLTLHIQVAAGQEVTEAEDDRAEPLLGLKELGLDMPDEKLIHDVSMSNDLVLSAYVSKVFSSAQQIAAIMKTHMPNISEIRFPMSYSKPLGDRDVACVLSSCRASLKVLEITNEVEFGELSCMALLKHSATLERFTLDRWPSRSSELSKRILSSCPKLHTFVTLGNQETLLSLIPFITADDFIDFDQESNTLKPWPCESTLKVLKVKIAKLSYRRPGTRATNGSKEELIQHQICERLSRFANLEELWLGHLAYEAGETEDEDEWDFEPLDEFDRMDAEICAKDKGDHQYSCPQMSLDSGLGQLETLKELRQLNVSLMATKIGPKEAEWMKEHWPKLRELDGLQRERKNHVMAVKWFQKNAPLIRVPLRSKTDFDNNC